MLQVAEQQEETAVTTPEVKTIKMKREQIFNRDFGQLMTKIYHHPVEHNFHRVHVHKITSQVKKLGQEVQKRVEDANKEASVKFDLKSKTPEEQGALMPQVEEYLKSVLEPWMNEEVEISFITALNANSLAGMKLSSADIDLLGELYEQAEA